MPRIYLSPSTQEWNPYITGSGSEEYHMNLLADAMIPYLLSNGIQFQRNTPEMTAASSIRQANAGTYDFYLALHSNASGAGHEGENRGIIAFYYPGSQQGQRAAELFAENLRSIYPLPGQVRTQATTTLGEVRMPRCPSVLLEIGYHDNPADASWIEGHKELMAQNLVLSLTEFFGLPFIWPMEVSYGTVTISYGTLNLRAEPSQEGAVLAQIPAGGSVSVYGEWQGWYVVHYGIYVGYAAAAYITLG